MHKKLYSLVIKGIIVVNTVCSTGNIYANNIDIEKDTRSERTSSQEDDYVDVPQEDEWAKFTTVASLTDWGALFIFLVINMSVIVLRYRDPNAIRGFKVPLNIGRVPVLSVLGILFCGVMLFHIEKKVFFAGVLFFLVGLVVYSMFWEREHKPLKHHERKVHHHVKH